MAERDIQLGPGVYVPPDAFDWSYARSGGPGGQNVNKRSTKAVLRIAVEALGLRPGQRSRLIARAGRYLTQDDQLVIAADEYREQARNREACIARLRALVKASLPPPKLRKKTKPTRGSVERRIGAKKRRAEIKKRRGERYD